MLQIYGMIETNEIPPHPKKELTMSEKPLIYIVEDDDGIRNMMIYALRASGFSAEGFPDGRAFWASLSTTRPDLVMLDIMLPGEDGMSLLARLRRDSRTSTLPVIMASAKGTEFDKVSGLDGGADDYLAKPFGMAEMVSRVRAVLRRIVPPTENSVLAQGALVLDPTSRIVTVSGAEVTLTLKEYELLRLFLENPGKVFSREQLLSAVWGMDFVGESRTVDVHIATLRDKIGVCGEMVETVRGVGYRMAKKTL